MVALRGILVLLFIAFCGPVARGEEPDEEIKRLKKELAALRQENERLREALRAQGEKKPAVPEPGARERAAAAGFADLGGVINQGRYRPGDTVVSLGFNSPLLTDRDLGALAELKALKSLELPHAKVSDCVLAHIKGLKQLEDLNLWDSTITDAGLEPLKGLPNLSSLVLTGTRVAGPGLVHLKDLGKLRYLNLIDTPIRDQGLESLAALKQVRILHLDGTKITDAGLVHLAKLEGLEGLNLSKTAITDLGLKHLHGLRRLQCLTLTGTQVTEEGVDELQRALPGVHVFPLKEPVIPMFKPPFRVPFPLTGNRSKFGPFPPGR
jgi:Leucine-rich repeat (LRR) protein